MKYIEIKLTYGKDLYRIKEKYSAFQVCNYDAKEIRCTRNSTMEMRHAQLKIVKIRTILNIEL